MAPSENRRPRMPVASLPATAIDTASPSLSDYRLLGWHPASPLEALESFGQDGCYKAYLPAIQQVPVSPPTIALRAMLNLEAV
ncbi:hypothetical protein PV08_10676 [Exophiala spinifera]|uniref:Uncharacterized protein n=1 Tax=Exophiala spinifera TaxID=91928 RepID=A0A0D1Y8R0_9EURO|nr:uncharacterized protein PV08_10676 [Exophiala spinifera]KIW11376.1 hypothetical protein PV08_10676 [Exophiala spinifera]